ncbi:MAG: helix-turn-helix domain-containing protein [Chitinophagales bacterium]
MEKEILSRLEKIEFLLEMQNLYGKKILTVEEASMYLGLSTSYLYKLTHKNLIPFSKPNNKKIYFQKIDLDNWALSNQKSSNNEIEERASSYLISKKISNGKKSK